MCLSFNRNITIDSNTTQTRITCFVHKSSRYGSDTDPKSLIMLTKDKSGDTFPLENVFKIQER